MRINQLTEGVRYGSTQRNEVLSSLNDFGFGFEIELNPPDGYDDDGNDNVYENVHERVFSDGFVISDLVFDDLAEHVFYAVRDLSNISDAFSSYNAKNKKSVLNSSNIETMKTLATDSGMRDMFPIEYVHALIETLDGLVGDNETLHSVLKYITELSENPVDRFDVIGAIIYTDEVESDVYEKIEESDVNSLISAYTRLVEVLKDDFFDLLPDRIYDVDTEQSPPASTIKPFTELSDTEKEEILRVYEDEAFIENLRIALDGITGNKLYHENMDFSPLYDSARQKVIEIAFYMNGEDTLQNLLESINLTMEEITDVFDALMEQRRVIDDLIDDAENQESDFIGDLEDFFKNSVLPQLSRQAQKFSYRTEIEYDEQIEIILDNPVYGGDIMIAFNTMYEIIQKLEGYGFEARNNSGLHMSISYKGGTSSDFNMYKFIILSHVYDLVQSNNNMVRRFVNDVYSVVKDNLSEFVSDVADNAISDDQMALGLIVTDYIEYHLDLNKRMPSVDAKYHGINFNGYNIYDGRVELRFFGGEDYGEKYQEYLDIILRMMYILKVSSENTHDKEYMKTLVRTTNKILKNSKYQADLSDIVSRSRYANKILRSMGYDITIGKDIKRLKLDIIQMIDDIYDLTSDDVAKLDDAYYALDNSTHGRSAIIRPPFIKGLEVFRKHAE